MIDLSCDYNDGAHPSVLEALIETNMEKLPGYGADVHTERAADLIRKACGLPAARVFFLSGGTQTNAIVISAMLKSYEGAVCAATGPRPPCAPPAVPTPSSTGATPGR